MLGILPTLNKDLTLMRSSKFLLLALGSLLLYSGYINLVYVRVDQEIYPVYLDDPSGLLPADLSGGMIPVDSIEALREAVSDGYAIGVTTAGGAPAVVMASSGVERMDNHRAAYAELLLSGEGGGAAEAEIVGENDREMKSRREITAEFLFFELAAVGFLGLAATMFKEKQMGVIRVHGVVPLRPGVFVLSKLTLFLLADLAFASLLTVVNLGPAAGLAVLPGVLVHTGIISVIMALVGFFCALWLRDFRQFSLFYLVLVVFITTPVFLVAQTGFTADWIAYHPVYHLFMAVKNAYFGTPAVGVAYYTACGAAVAGLFLLVEKALARELAKEG